MPNAALSLTDEIIGLGLLSAESIVQELRERLIRQLSARRLLVNDLLTLARDTLREFEPMLADNIAAVDLAAWVAGVEAI